MIKPSVGIRAQNHELSLRFEKIRNLLLTDRFEQRLRNPLSFWALPSDRRLPRALLHRTLGDLLRTPFASLAATPGIGQKKIHSLLQLLDRALLSDDLEQETLELPTVAQPGLGEAAFDAPDPADISEVTWAKWRATVGERGLGDQPIGRFAESLHDLPRVIWSTPLSFYAGRTLQEIRRLKTHGEKRVRRIVTIFGRLHAHLSNDRQARVSDLTPEGIDDVDVWSREAAVWNKLPSFEELRINFLSPLVDQIRIDAGEQTAELVMARLGWDQPRISVRRAAMKLNLTRARIYQLLEDAATVVHVRWPRGLVQLQLLLQRFADEPFDSPSRKLLQATAETFFPEEYRPAMQPMPAFLRRFDAPQPASWTPASQMAVS